MKFIHLGDLHIGKRVNEFSMINDQREILKQIITQFLLSVFIYYITEISK